MLEREAKLRAPAGFELPPLGALVPGVTATGLTERHLDAVYYDTSDLRLARSGITLRHRDGDDGPVWVVKLPRGPGRGAVLARREIGFRGTPERIPEVAADLVLASTRGRALSPVADLQTLRRPVELRGADRRLLAEVVDDTVVVSRGQCRAGEFHEVEVELRGGGPRARRVLDAVVVRLIEAGCVAAVPVPRLVRALGEPATRPPDVVSVALREDAGAADWIRHAVTRSVAQILRHDPGVRLGDDPEDVHQMRVGTRRLRSDLGTFGALLDQGRVASARDDLRWLGRRIGAVRDADVLAQRLRRSGAALSDEDQPGVAMLLHRLRSEDESARCAMLEALDAPRYLNLLDTLVQLAADPPIAEGAADGEPRLESVAAKPVRRAWKRLARAAARLDADAPDTELHRVRILAKQCRYAAEAAVPVRGPAAERFADAIAGLQTVLGDHQDTVMAESWLRAAATAMPPAGAAAGQLIATERAVRAELRASWPDAWHEASRKRLRRWL